MPGRSKKHAAESGLAIALARGIPRSVIEALIDVGAVDPHDMTPDSLLSADLHLDDIDLVEVGELLGVEDECLDWERISDVLESVKRRKAKAVSHGRDDRAGTEERKAEGDHRAVG